MSLDVLRHLKAAVTFDAGRSEGSCSSGMKLDKQQVTPGWLRGSRILWLHELFGCLVDTVNGLQRVAEMTSWAVITLATSTSQLFLSA